MLRVAQRPLAKLALDPCLIYDTSDEGMAAGSGTSLLAKLAVLCHVVKSLQLIWWSGIRIWNLRVHKFPGLWFQKYCTDLT